MPLRLLRAVIAATLLGAFPSAPGTPGPQAPAPNGNQAPPGHREDGSAQPAEAAPAPAGENYLTLQRRLIDIFERHAPAVVKVFASHQPGSEGGQPLVYVGTGFFISKDGLILTNANITAGAARVRIIYDNVEYLAEELGHDPRTNISLLRAVNIPDSFTYLRLAESREPLAIGTLLIAITCELGLDPGPAMGMVKGHDTHYGQRAHPTVYLRADIPSDGGEGGAPVFDLNGRLVGMSIVSLPDIRSSYVLPARAMRRVIDDLRLEGHVDYAWLGIEAAQRADRENGVHLVIEKVGDNSPASEAGLREGDVIRTLGEYETRRHTDLKEALFFLRPGTLVSVDIQRGGDTLELPLRVGALDEARQPEDPRNHAEAAPAEAVGSLSP